MAGRTRAQEVRIIGGKWKGRKLRVHGSRELRPTLARTRETLMNWLRPELNGMRVLDAFAGSGVLGLEALSQGAASCLFVEYNHRAASTLTEHIDVLQARPQAQVLRTDFFKLPKAVTESKYDLILLDPPFQPAELLIKAVAQARGLAANFVYAESSDAQLLDKLAAEHTLTVRGRTRSGDAHAHLWRIT